MKKIIVSILLLTVMGCGRGEIPEKKEEAAASVTVMKVAKGDMREVLSYVGDIRAQEEVVIYSKVAGKLIENKVKEGDRVRKDDALALIDRDEIGFKFEQAPVTSPIDGIVGQVYLDKGAHLRSSSDMSSGTPVALVVDMDTMQVKINVIERDLPKVREGQKANIRVDAYPDEIFIGEVDRVSPVVDLASRTALAEIKIPNEDHRLKSGMFARVKVITERKENVLLVPLKAIIYQEGKEILFVVEENVANLREVETGLKDGDRIEIASGLKGGEKVIIDGGYGLKNGAKVRAR